MRSFWKKNTIISIKLNESVYSLAQMVNDSTKMQFFGIFNTKDEWKNTNLNDIEHLFCVSVGNVVIQKLGVRKIKYSEARPSNGPFKHYFIKPHENFEEGSYKFRDGEFMWKGGSLIDCKEDLSIDPYYASVLIENLNVVEHRDMIVKYEFENMYGDNHVRERLLNFHETGKDYNSMKELVFPEL